MTLFFTFNCEGKKLFHTSDTVGIQIYPEWTMQAFQSLFNLYQIKTKAIIVMFLFQTTQLGIWSHLKTYVIDQKYNLVMCSINSPTQTHQCVIKDIICKAFRITLPFWLQEIKHTTYCRFIFIQKVTVSRHKYKSENSTIRTIECGGQQVRVIYKTFLAGWKQSCKNCFHKEVFLSRVRTKINLGLKSYIQSSQQF